MATQARIFALKAFLLILPVEFTVALYLYGSSLVVHYQRYCLCFSGSGLLDSDATRKLVDFAREHPALVSLNSWNLLRSAEVDGLTLDFDQSHDDGEISVVAEILKVLQKFILKNVLRVSFYLKFASQSILAVCAVQSNQSIVDLHRDSHVVFISQTDGSHWALSLAPFTPVQFWLHCHHCQWEIHL